MEILKQYTTLVVYYLQLSYLQGATSDRRNLRTSSSLRFSGRYYRKRPKIQVRVRFSYFINETEPMCHGNIN